MSYADHMLYEQGDSDAPEIIKDANGDIVLSLCKRCGKGESELEGPCKPAEPPCPLSLHPRHQPPVRLGLHVSRLSQGMPSEVLLYHRRGLARKGLIGSLGVRGALSFGSGAI
jgi:hypothetical protein